MPSGSRDALFLVHVPKYLDLTPEIKTMSNVVYDPSTIYTTNENHERCSLHFWHQPLQVYIFLGRKTFAVHAPHITAAQYLPLFYSKKGPFGNWCRGTDFWTAPFLSRTLVNIVLLWYAARVARKSFYQKACKIGGADVHPLSNAKAIVWQLAPSCLRDTTVPGAMGPSGPCFFFDAWGMGGYIHFPQTTKYI